MTTENVARPSTNLDAMFKPRAIAILGASGDSTKLSGRPLKFLREMGYAGQLYPINPKYQEVQGLPCYPDLKSVPGEIDLAIIGLPAAAVPQAVRECGEAGVKAAVIFSSGFAEVGAEGKQLQAELQAAAREGNVLICGPNCAGLLGVPERVIATFNTALERGVPLSGEAAFVSQSGALGTYMFAAAQDAGVGFNYWVSTGNEAVLGFADFVSYFVRDERTRTVMAYMEDARDGEALRACAAEAVEREKPLVVLKVGTSEAGAKAASSHTGAMAGSDRVYDAFFRKHGIIRARNVEELFDYATAATSNRRPRGNRVALMTISGGAGILMADTCEENGLALPKPSPAIREELLQVLPPFGSAENPIDLTAELISRPDLLRRSMEITLRDEQYDSLIIFLGLQLGTGEKLARDIAAVAAGTDKLVVVNWMAPPPEALRILREAEVPVFPDPTRGVKAVAALAQYMRFVQERKEAGRSGQDPPLVAANVAEEVKQYLRGIRASGRTTLTEDEAKHVLQRYGVPVTRRAVARDAGEAADLAARIGFPVVMKVVSPDITHKTEAGGVRLGIADAAAARQAYREIMESCARYKPGARLEGVLVEEMVSGGTEVIVGAKRDARLGPAVTFGLGGIFVELLKDFALRLAPLSRAEAEAMVREIKGYRMLAGFRGQELKDVPALVDALLRVAQLAYDQRDLLAEMDVNPLLVLGEGKGVRAVDALMVLQG